MAGDMTLAVTKGGEDTAGGHKAALISGGGIWSKVSRKFMNVMSFIRGLKSGRRNRQAAAAPPRKDDVPPGSGEEFPPENPITSTMEKQELGKAVFLLAVPMTTGLVFLKGDTLSPTVVHFTYVANVAGSTAIWKGILLRKTCYSGIANVVEMAGVGSVFLGFHVLVGNYLPPELWFFPAICWLFSVLPFVMAAVPGGGIGIKEEDACPV